MKYFITFGAGNQNYYDAGHRLLNQINNLNLFDKTTLYTDEYLKNDSEFWSKHEKFITNNKRGYGYWLWKPYIIKKTMETMNEGDILLYLDCGCEIDIKKKIELVNHLEMIKNEYIIATHTYIEKEWNKMDFILKMDMLNDKFLNTLQYQAGVILFLVCEKTIDIVNKWYELGCEYHNIDDSPSITPNFPCFIEHRHDQSIFSLLTKKYGFYNSNNSLLDCISCLKNISGVSKL